MKKLLIAIVCFISIVGINAQQLKGISGENNWLDNWSNFKPTITEYRDANQILSGVISKDFKLTKDNTYRLVGVVYVTNNAKLTIEPGTVIRGDSETCGTLVITKGASIIAEGKETDPIVFTSNKEASTRKPGDWGGIVILGNAPISKIGGISTLDFNLNPAFGQYGGEIEDSNSCILKYVRIEFAGKKLLNTSKELNGLTLAGVGNKSVIAFVQVSYSKKDSFKSNGGFFNFNNTVSYLATDDDFDFTEGTQCNISNSIAIRNPYNSDASGSRCFEVKSFDKKEDFDPSKKITKISANNITLVNTEENTQGLVREAIYIRENANFNIKNSVVSGFDQAILLEDKIAVSSYKDISKITFDGLLINNCKSIIESENTVNNNELKFLFAVDDPLKVSYSSELNKTFFNNSKVKENPDFRLKIEQTVADIR